MRRPEDLARRAVRSVERWGRDRWRERLLATGTDVTARSAGATALVVAPHPDDETFGCGATIARKRASGTRVRVLVAADGSGSHPSTVLAPGELAEIRAAEVADACRALGVEAQDLVLLGLADDSLGARVDELADRIAAELDQAEPEEVLVASRRDWHPDHQACSAAVRAAVARRPVDRRPRVLEYPVWLWVHGPWEADAGGPWAARQPRAFASGVREVLRPGRAELVRTEGHLAAKQRAIRAHRSQLTNLTGEPSWPVFDDTFVAGTLLTHEVAFPVDDHAAPPRRAASTSR